MRTGQSRPIGRPRGFDADEALERAMLVFWEHGYEGASLANLTDAMGISTTSMYAAFGNKEELFRKALERYTEGPSAYFARALDEPTALGVATAILAGAVRTTTRPARPHGCLGVQGALAAGDSGRGVRELLAAWRNDGCTRVRDRFQRAVDDGDLPPESDPGLLARYVTTLTFGIAVQAASGAGREELQEMADAALRDWPIA
ncbi:MULTISPECIES: TetR/AcrR family transcriptional regulator [Streptomyces]|uniref:TetR/AcrR family transcriptional regulator n=2 Tax=Streptomyces TaxID=1883 RepID=A0A3R7EX26_9ACTN|nr:MULTISPECIES: TetR/AcrR family transcriptional regulator [Streptomyces]KNE82121.1 TetR family transcriptional regulator [Streptomyces fradiae]OFA56510.1 TetR family transcriptional regulator [Streptomyces fradiae]PQM22770.1 TetR/AcrR family transcriptional regulator [Streptomyces xinghaiensis]RKM97939.1 TetR/AcrR family transcriptional regulator [Streptomyces xinghaiensis]RNC73924.1 TetR/AcrR family transcriptional regulator [Streptomyces xinghaiensis]